MKIRACFLALLIIPFHAYPQKTTYEAFKLSELMLNATWTTTQASLPILISGIQTQLLNEGVSKQTADIYAEELQKRLNREVFSKALAIYFSSALSVEEIDEVASFLKSRVGKKYLALSQDMMNNSSFVAAIMKPACDETFRRISKPEQHSLKALCAQ